MDTKIKKSTLTSLILAIFLWLLPAMSWAALMVTQEVVSGHIVEINADHSVRLDDGNTYYPSREGLVINLQRGEPVTLRYYVEGKTKNVFFEYAGGLNSLKQNPAETSQKEKTLK